MSIKLISTKKNMFFLLAITVIAVVLRFWGLGNVPISPDWDEVALGYNAYSILHTGQDEFGKFLPVVLRSFDDYKPALYTYLIIPFLPFFDLSVFAVRLPSAIFGIVTVIGVYMLVRELFADGFEFFRKKIKGETLALTTSFFLAISPWHIQFSRIAFEANVGVGWNVFTALFFLKGLKKPYFLIFAAITSALSIYTYQSEKVFAPLFLFALIVVYRKKLFNLNKKYIIYSLITGIVIMMPLLFYSVNNKEIFARAQGVSIFAEQTQLLKKEIKKAEYDKKTNNYFGYVLDNRRVLYGKKILENYLSHFDLNWLFVTGDKEINRHHAPNMGLLYIFTLPLLIVGVVKLFSSKLSGVSLQSVKLITAWVLIAPIPASITNGVPHSVRTLNFLPTFDIFIAIGAIFLFLFVVDKIKFIIFRLLIYAVFVLFAFINFSYYLNQYLVQQNYYYAPDWQYGYKDAVDISASVKNKYSKIIISNKGAMTQSYMFFLFYLKYDPQKYLSEGGTASGRFEYSGNAFDKFEFRTFDYNNEKKNTLLIGAPGDFPEVYKQVGVVHFPDKSVAIRFVEKD